MVGIKAEAVEANDQGVKLADARRYAEAIPFYEKALRLAPRWYAPHMNLGIARKHSGQWAGSLSSSLKAIELDAEGAGAGALWNVGVAATALDDWFRARWAWTKLGIALPPGEGPIDMNIGITPIRVSCDQSSEVVWCHRIDPARARIQSIPTPESGRHYRDLLLHDGEPRGQRRYGDETLSVFDELAVLEKSRFRTWKVDVVAPSSGDIEKLIQSAAGAAALEDWTASLRILCRQCSEGTPHEHQPSPQAPWKAERTIGVAADDEAVFAVIAQWGASNAGCSASEPELLLP